MAFTSKTMTRIELFFDVTGTEDPIKTPLENALAIQTKLDSFVSGEAEGSKIIPSTSPSGDGIVFSAEIHIPDEESSVRLRTKLENNLDLFDSNGATLRKPKYFLV